MWKEATKWFAKELMQECFFGDNFVEEKIRLDEEFIEKFGCPAQGCYFGGTRIVKFSGFFSLVVWVIDNEKIFGKRITKEDNDSIHEWLHKLGY